MFNEVLIEFPLFVLANMFKDFCLEGGEIADCIRKAGAKFDGSHGFLHIVYGRN